MSGATKTAAGSKLLSVLAGAGITFGLNVLLAVVGYLLTDDAGHVPSMLVFAGFFWLLQLLHVVPCAIGALVVRRPYAIAGMVLASLLCSFPSFLAFSLMMTAASVHV